MTGHDGAKTAGMGDALNSAEIYQPSCIRMAMSFFLCRRMNLPIKLLSLAGQLDPA